MYSCFCACISTFTSRKPLSADELHPFGRGILLFWKGNTDGKSVCELSGIDTAQNPDFLMQHREASLENRKTGAEKSLVMDAGIIIRAHTLRAHPC
jgi:membrane carboxypeptidase/penicillin-binding protein PbpC